MDRPRLGGYERLVRGMPGAHFVIDSLRPLCDVWLVIDAGCDTIPAVSGVLSEL